MAALADEMEATAEPSRADMERTKDAVHELAVARFEAIVAARTRVQARYGMAGFAELYGPFSSAERYVNRAWSALVDQHWPEAKASVARAAEDLARTKSVLDTLASAST